LNRYGSGGSPPLGNGCYTEYDYDDARRLTKITNKKSNGTVISSWEYEYNDDGYVTKRTDKDSNEIGYGYDDVHRLTSIDYPSGSDYIYEYDSVGNRIRTHEITSSSTITTTYTYDDADELTQWTTSTVTMTFTYASDGSLKTKSDGTDTWTYEWDYERRLEAFKKNSATLVEYRYNPTGTRRQASDATLGVVNYFHTGGHVLADYNSNWALKTSYVRLPDCLEIVGMLDRTADPTPVYYFAKDGQMSTRELLNGFENVVTRYSYDAWGDPTETKLTGDISSLFRFMAQIYSEEVEASLDNVGPYLAETARSANGVVLNTPTKLVLCSEAAQTDYWWWFCVLGEQGCRDCCAREYGICTDNCKGIFMEDPRATSLTGDGRDSVTRLYWELRGLIVGDGVPGIVIPNPNREECEHDCFQKDHTCRHWCKDKEAYNRRFHFGELDGEDLDRCYSEEWEEGHFDITNWKDSWDGRDYVCLSYMYHIKDGSTWGTIPIGPCEMHVRELCAGNWWIGVPGKKYVGEAPSFADAEGGLGSARGYCDRRGPEWLAEDDY